MDVLVVDDDPDLRTALRRALALEGHGAILVGSAGEAIELLRTRSPDLAIIDRGLPDLDGIELCRRLRTAGDDLPVLILTARTDVNDRVEGLDAGADDYLAKPFDVNELLARVRALARRSSEAPRGREPERELLSYADVVLDDEARVAHRGSRSLQLSPTEWDLLRCFLRHPNTVLGRDRISREVWGSDSAGTANNLEVYVGYLRRKLEAEGERRLVHTVRGIGYVLREDAPS